MIAAFFLLLNVVSLSWEFSLLDSYQLILLAVFILCIALSFFLSGSEVAFFSLKSDQVNRLSKSEKQGERTISLILSDSQKLLVTILLANNVVNVLASIIAVTLTYDFLQGILVDPFLVIIFNVVIMTFILLILSEITPKILGAQLSVRYAAFAAPLMLVILFFSTPFVWLIMRLTRWVHLPFQSAEKISNSDLKTIADVVHEHGSIEEDEKNMISSLAGFSERTVNEIMISRVDMVAVESDSDYQTVMETVRQSGHSRIPVFTESLDNINGILYAKDLIPFLAAENETKSFKIEKLIRQPLFIPEGKKVSDLLKEFQLKKMHIAIVVDEYGGTAGIVTLDDVIAEIIGEIHDEHDIEQPLYKQLAPNIWLFDGKTPVDIAEEVLALSLQTHDDGFETLAGFILSLSGTIPKEKAMYKQGPADFIVEQMEGRRIAKIKVILRD